MPSYGTISWYSPCWFPFATSPCQFLPFLKSLLLTWNSSYCMVRSRPPWSQVARKLTSPSPFPPPSKVPSPQGIPNLIVRSSKTTSRSRLHIVRNNYIWQCYTVHYLDSVLFLTVAFFTCHHYEFGRYKPSINVISDSAPVHGICIILDSVYLTPVLLIKVPLLLHPELIPTLYVYLATMQFSLTVYLYLGQKIYDSVFWTLVPFLIVYAYT